MAGPKWVNQNPELVFCTQDGHNQPRQAGTPCKKCRARLLKAKKRRELYKKSEEHIRVRAERNCKSAKPPALRVADTVIQTSPQKVVINAKPSETAFA